MDHASGDLTDRLTVLADEKKKKITIAAIFPTPTCNNLHDLVMFLRTTDMLKRHLSELQFLLTLKGFDDSGSTVFSAFKSCINGMYIFSIFYQICSTRVNWTADKVQMLLFFIRITYTEPPDLLFINKPVNTVKTFHFSLSCSPNGDM